MWGEWSNWSQLTSQCPATRTRTRNCVADPSMAGVNVSQPLCNGTCPLNVDQLELEQVNTPRCDNGDGDTLTTTSMFHKTTHCCSL